MAENENTVKERDNRPVRNQPNKDNIGGEIIHTLETIEDDYSRFKNTINDLKNNLQSFMENTSYELGEVKQKTEQKAEKEVVEKKVGDVEEDIDEVDERLNEVMQEVGFGEEINVSNLPPVLLEKIYQKTLDEIIEELRDNLGNHEANLVIQEELENMRMRTSGSELFQYDGRDINIRNLVSSIENNLISSKQIHSTFQELVQKLSERIPTYRPRKFRAMVNAEGLEFVIKKTIKLLDKTARLEDGLSDIETSVQNIEAELDNKYSEMTSRIQEIEEKLDKDIVNKYTDLDYRLSEFEDMFEDLDIDEISGGLDEVREKNEHIEERIEEMTSDFEMSLSIVQDDVNNLKKNFEEESITEEERFVFYAIPNDGATLKKLQKEVGGKVEDVESKLENLREKGKIEVEKRGRWTVYVRCEEEPIKEMESEEESEEIEDHVDDVIDEIDESESEEELSEEEEAESDEELIEGDFEGIIFDEGFTMGAEKKEEVEEEKETFEDESDLDEVEEKPDEIEDDDITEEQKLVMDEIPDDGCTIHQLDKQFENYDKSDIEKILEELIEKNKVSTTKRNRWTIYLKQKEVE